MVNLTDYSEEQLKELAFTDEERKELERARRSSYRRRVCGISGPETTKNRYSE